MRTDITKETLQAAIDELGDSDKVAARFRIQPRRLYYYGRKYGVDVSLKSKRPMAGSNGEYEVYTWLRARKFKPEMAPYTSPFDIKCNGKRIEVKCASLIDGEWLFNIHRHGKLDESEVDVYILRLKDAPFMKSAIHLVMPAPVGIKTVRISPRSLLTRYAQYFNKLEYLN